MQHRLLHILSLVVALGLLAPAFTAANDDARMDAELRASLSRTIRGILIESLPERIENEEHWGDQKEIFSGVRIERVEGRLRAEKRTRAVNHGLWQRVSVMPIDPEKNLEFQILDARSIGPQKVAFELTASAPLEGTARIERWRMGVKMLNFTTEAQATIRLRLRGEVTHRMELKGNKTHIALEPIIHDVDLQLDEFDLQKLGLVNGPLAEELGNLAKPTIGRQLAKQEPHVTAKINTALQREHEQMRLAVDWSWLNRMYAAFVPAATVAGQSNRADSAK